ncbi:MAG: DUF4358 domain-containing protein [Clostridia bacterium]|nr:DUF4358 domain-containing protein [Clostridia bacterium]
MKKLIALLFTLTLVFSLSACGATTSNEVEATTLSGNNVATDIDIHAVLEQITLLVKDDEPMDIDEDALTSLYGIDTAWVKDFACIATMSGVFPSDILMFEAADEAGKDSIKQVLDAKLDDFLTQAQNYDEDSYAIAKSCKVIENGDYIALFLAPLHEDMENLFLGK